MKVLVIDVGGTHVKLLATGHKEKLEFDSGPSLTAARMVARVKEMTAKAGWKHEVISMGYPGPVLHDKPMLEPYNLGRGWVGFHFHKAFGRPIKIINDAALQAVGSYRGGRMLFLGLGTGLGSALIVDSVVEPLELAHLPYKKGKTFEDYVGIKGLEKSGKKKWRKNVMDVVERLLAATQADYAVLGGGNARLMKELPPKTFLGDNGNAFRGGFRLWEEHGPDTPRQKYYERRPAPLPGRKTKQKQQGTE